MNGENTSEPDIREAYITLYKEMYENGDYAEHIYAEISDMLYAEHIEIDKARQASHEMKLPYDEYPYDPDEEFDPYAYNPNRMSDGDYDRMHELIAEDRAEAEQLIGKNVRINGKNYNVTGIVPNGEGGFLAELRTELGVEISEDVDVVREWFITAEKAVIVSNNADDDIAIEVAAVEHDRLAADMLAGGGYGDDEANAKAEERLPQSLRSAAFEKIKANHDFKAETIELLDRIEQQMNVNNYDAFNMQMLRLPVFQQKYGMLPRISEKMFDGKLKEIATELNGYITTPAAGISDSGPYQEVDQGNFKIGGNILSDGGQKTRYAANVTAIRTLKKIETEGRTATSDEQKILSQYVGWGGIPQAFDSNNDKWSKEYTELEELLTDEEYAAARDSTVNAHYTTPTVINAIYKAVGNMGFKNGNVLEPAMGVGNFFGCMPEEMRESKLFGVELDSITGRIARQLYPNANIQIKGYEKTDFPDNFFDLAVGNVPFGNYPVADKRYDKVKFPIHDYFFAKTLDKVAPGGIVAFITSKGTLDKANTKTREYLAKRADLIGAVRLPNNAFKGNANTEVTSDIIFLQKREKMAVEKPDWCYIGSNEEGIPVNQYYLDHPEMILGKMSEDGKMYGGYNTTCVPIEGADLAVQLDKAVAQLKANISVKRIAEENEKERGIIPATEDVRNFTYTLIDGKMYFRENNIMTEVDEKGAKLERMKALHGLRNIMRGVIAAQENRCSDEELSVLQTALNEQYDQFVKKCGNIGERANSSVFSDDDDYNLLCAIENYDSETKTYSKSDIFEKRTIKPTTEITHVDTPQVRQAIAFGIPFPH